MIIMIIYNQENQTCQDERDKQLQECTCQGEQSNHTVRKVTMWGQIRGSINIISMSMP